MEGFLRGKCVPGDLKVNETNAEYLVRKFGELENKCAALAAEVEAVKSAHHVYRQSNGCFIHRGDNSNVLQNPSHRCFSG
jgi:hypothetical protein